MLKQHRILIVIDMQYDFIDGSLGTPEAKEIVDNVRNKIMKCKDAGYEIYFTQDTHGKKYLQTFEGQHLPVEHCIYGTSGWKIHEKLFDILDHNTDYAIIHKYSFGVSEWAEYLPDSELIDEIQICGLCTDICVISNALILRALYPEIKIICDASCCAGTTPDMHRKALDIMKNCQIDVINVE